jgi:hypothetical protein
MERFKEIVTNHPMWVVGGVLVGILLIWWYSSSGSSSTAQTAAYNPNTDPNVIAANAGLAATQSTNQTALGIAQLQATSQGQQLTAQDQALQDIANAALGGAQAQYQSQTDVAQATNAAAVSIAQIQASGTVAETQAAGAAALALQEQATPSVNLNSMLAALTSIATSPTGGSGFHQGDQTGFSGWGTGINTGTSAGAYTGPISGPEISQLFNNILSGYNPHVAASVAPVGSNWQGVFGQNYGNVSNTVKNVNA